MNSFYKHYLKRILDIFLCSISIVVLSPIFALTAIAIRLSSPGPVLYHSVRVGKDKIPFNFYKFRSMHTTNNDKGLYIADSDRLFLVGRIIRRMKIDELPQLFNVIKGDMSIVGPRPMPFSSVDSMYSGNYDVILTIRPGLTSAASLFDYTVGDSYKDNDIYIKEVIPYKKEMELLYFERECFYYDMELIIRTIMTIVRVIAGQKKFPLQWEYIEVCNRMVNEQERIK